MRSCLIMLDVLCLGNLFKPPRLQVAVHPHLHMTCPWPWDKKHACFSISTISLMPLSWYSAGEVTNEKSNPWRPSPDDFNGSKFAIHTFNTLDCDVE